MTELWIALGVLGGVGVLVLLTAFICFRMAFYVTNRSKVDGEEFSLPPGKEYVPHHDQMQAWHNEVSAIPYRTLTVRSFDGLTLYGKYYEYAPGAPIELMFHGYRGSAQRDLCGGVQRCFALGRSALIVDQRACGKSGGNVIGFGILESKDCPVWVDCILREIDPDARIILTGISMGASTVVMAAAQPLPPNVVGVLADCGYTSAREIIKTVIRGMKLPADLLYPFVRLGARLFGHFDPDETSPFEAAKQSRLPIIFFHGEADDFVPCHMSQSVYDACITAKKLVTVPGAGHGLGYVLDPDGYLKALAEFSKHMGC
ncbi:MAG: alpha/beta hydrolase [Clostridia bacterium]|nr:alpha/beta hydrolase [Clostridia bacterium]